MTLRRPLRRRPPLRRCHLPRHPLRRRRLPHLHRPRRRPPSPVRHSSLHPRTGASYCARRAARARFASITAGLTSVPAPTAAAAEQRAAAMSAATTPVTSWMATRATAAATKITCRTGARSRNLPRGRPTSAGSSTTAMTGTAAMGRECSRRRRPYRHGRRRLPRRPCPLHLGRPTPPPPTPSSLAS